MSTYIKQNVTKQHAVASTLKNITRTRLLLEYCARVYYRIFQPETVCGPKCSFSEALKKSNLQTLKDRRVKITRNTALKQQLLWLVLDCCGWSQPESEPHQHSARSIQFHLLVIKYDPFAHKSSLKTCLPSFRPCLSSYGLRLSSFSPHLPSFMFLNCLFLVPPWCLSSSISSLVMVYFKLVAPLFIYLVSTIEKNLFLLTTTSLARPEKQRGRLQTLSVL